MLLRTIGRLTPTFIIPIIGERNNHDVIITNTAPSLETGWDRVKHMYKMNEYGETSTELHTVIQSSLTGAFIGACFGGFVKSRQAYLYFIENNQATIFRSTRDAQKKLQDYVLIAFAKGAYEWGWRVGTFTGIFSLLATSISVYRGDTSIVEYIAAGTLTGAAYRCNLGLAGTIVGAGLGATLSLIAGTIVVSLLKITGVSMNDIRQALYKLKEAREDQMHQAEEKASQEKHNLMTKHHDVIVEQRGEQKLADM